ncbi:olfactory receptor 30 [Bombyx mori]|uniref:Odorant receptor n=1 Tax=Bombyx mori TaxID=7091 RepID=Q0EEG0_BOMMO|nr:olfactory receptor 30 [Bombyx mori]BAF31190.1 candidate olfactory receptor [Bombyx mori]
MSVSNLKFEALFKPTTMSLHMNRSHPSIKRNKIWLLQFISLMTLTAFCATGLITSLLFHDLKFGKYMEASKNGTIAMLSFTTTFKYSLLLYLQKSLNRLIAKIDMDYEIAKGLPPQEKATVLNYAKKGVIVSKFWLFTAFAITFCFPLKAFIIMGYRFFIKNEFRLEPMFDMTYPEPIESYKTSFPVYFILFVVFFLFGCYASSLFVAFDPLVPIFVLHACGQLDLLSLRITKLFSDTKNPRIIAKELKVIISKLQELYGFVNFIKVNFSILYEYNMKITTISMPLSAFQVVESLRRGEFNIEFTYFFFGCILHFVMPCYYSNLLMERSENFRFAIYSCGWENHHDKNIRQMLLFMLTRATEPLGIATVFTNNSLDTFAEMCRQSYTIFNLMNAAWA